MTTLISELCKAYSETYASCFRQRQTLENEINQLKAELEHLKYPSWIDMIVRPIAEKMQADFPDRHFEILGPFGLNSEVSIHFYKNGVSEIEEFQGDNCLSITLVPISLNDEEFAILDTGTNTHEYPEETIAAMNGANNPRIPILPFLEIGQLSEIMKDRKNFESYKSLVALGSSPMAGER